MSNLLFPALPGLAFPVKRAPLWTTNVHQSAAGMSARVALQKYPLYQWTVTHEVLRDTPLVATSELALLWGLYNAVRGRYDSFLYQDPVYNTVANEPFGTGDGVTTAFPLIATFRAGPTYPGQAELIQNLNGAPTIKDNGSTVSGGAYTIGPTAIITFTTAPVAGHALTWSGGFYYRCIFSSDDAEFDGFLNKMWAMQSLQFESIYLATQ